MDFHKADKLVEHGYEDTITEWQRLIGATDECCRVECRVPGQGAAASLDAAANGGVAAIRLVRSPETLADRSGPEGRADPAPCGNTTT